MTTKDFKNLANSKVKEKSGMLMPVFLVYVLIMAAIQLVSYYVHSGAASVISLILTGPLTLGIVMIAYRILDEQDVQVKDLFAGFEMNFGTALVLHLTNTIFITLWTLLLIVPGIMKSYSYRMSFYILADNPDMSATDARKASIEMMDGHRMDLFKIDLSYIGWIILSAFTFDIPYLYYGPRMEAAIAAFYREISGQNVKVDMIEDVMPSDVTIDTDYVEVE